MSPRSESSSMADYRRVERIASPPCSVCVGVSFPPSLEVLGKASSWRLLGKPPPHPHLRRMLLCPFNHNSCVWTMASEWERESDIDLRSRNGAPESNLSSGDCWVMPRPAHGGGTLDPLALCLSRLWLIGPGVRLWESCRRFEVFCTQLPG